ncbi:MAG: FHA domain-containing protein [Desulfobacteraceae bacterium]|jgi:pSer/pThr/pTyr-binding forkhead associated (FHA) protein
MPMLALIHEGLTVQTIPLEKKRLRIGRSADSDIFLDDKMVSNKHASVEMRPDPDRKGRVDYFIQDLGSTNHTYVNGEKIVRHKLVHEDRIRIGKHLFKFIDDKALLDEKTTKLHKSWIPGVYYTKD